MKLNIDNNMKENITHLELEFINKCVVCKNQTISVSLNMN